MVDERTTRTAEPAAFRAWLRERLLPSGVASLMLAAYAMLLAALISFVLFQRDLTPSLYYLGIVGLAAMFVVHVIMPDLDAWLGERRSSQFHLPINGAIWLLVAWITLSSAQFSFVPFLLFMLVAEAIVTQPARMAAIYCVGLLLGWAGVLLLSGFEPAEIGANLISLSTGLIFVTVFSAVHNLYRAQTARAEALLAQLTHANAALDAARRREQELAVAEERLRIARDIHDGLGHHLTALTVQLQAAERLVERDPARAAAAIATSREVAQAALGEVRQSVAAMRRDPLAGRPLTDALAALADEFGRRTGMNVRFTHSGEAAGLGPATAQTLYRTAQEGLTNALKHGAARNAAIVLTVEQELVTLTVRDDGAGAAAPAGEGFGLAGLRERAAQLGGSFSAGPAPDGGYHLVLRVPYAERSAAP
jgi:signal transduction histidine kinase